MQKIFRSLLLTALLIAPSAQAGSYDDAAPQASLVWRAVVQPFGSVIYYTANSKVGMTCAAAYCGYLYMSGKNVLEPLHNTCTYFNKNLPTFLRSKERRLNDRIDKFVANIDEIKEREGAAMTSRGADDMFPSGAHATRSEVNRTLCAQLTALVGLAQNARGITTYHKRLKMMNKIEQQFNEIIGEDVKQTLATVEDAHQARLQFKQRVSNATAHGSTQQFQGAGHKQIRNGQQ